MPRGMWNLTGAGIKPESPCIGKQILNHWIAQEIPIEPIFTVPFPSIRFLRILEAGLDFISLSILIYWPIVGWMEEKETT